MARRQGIITQAIEHDKMGSFGLIESEGAVFVWAASEFYRDGTRIMAGESVFFDPDGGYARRVGAPMTPLLPDGC